MKKAIYIVVGYVIGFIAVYIAGIAAGNLYTTVTSFNGQVSFISHPHIYLFFIPTILLFALGIFIISKGIDI